MKTITYSLALGALLASSLAFRVDALMRPAPVVKDGDQARIERFVRAAGFDVRPFPNLSGIAIVGGEMGTCRIAVAELSLVGWHNEVLRQIQTPDTKASYLFKGETYEEPPKWRARVAYYVHKVGTMLRIPEPDEKLYGMLVSDGCDRASLRLDGLTTSGP